MLHDRWVYRQCQTLEEQYCTFTLDQVLRRGHSNLIAGTKEELDLLRSYALIVGSNCTFSTEEVRGLTNVEHTDDNTYLYQG